MTDIVSQVQGRVDGWLRRVGRTSPGPLLVRVGLFVAALLGVVLAWPFTMLASPAFPAFLALAVLPALFPRSPLPTVYLLGALAGWVVSTTVLALAPDFLGLILLASALYLVHTLAALAAVLPHDAVVAPGVLLRWMRRAGLVLLLTGVLALFAVVVPGYLGGRSYLAASLLGLALMAGTVAYLARLVRRR
jgi:hypothetical protein